MAYLSDETVARLQKHAIPLRDTFDTVIARLLDHYEGSEEDAESGGSEPFKAGSPTKTSPAGVMEFDYKNPPSLRFTTISYAMINDTQIIDRDEMYWNKIMFRCINMAAEHFKDADKLLAFLGRINKVKGEHTGPGFVYLKQAGISVQQLEANLAFKQIAAIVELLGVNLRIEFRWNANDKAAYPTQKGILTT